MPFSIREIQNLLVNKAFNPYINIENSDRVLIHLLEECGEIAKAHRKVMNKRFNNNFNVTELEDEIGDLFILLCFYAESVKIDLQNATLNKIRKNIKKGKFGTKQTLKELKGLGELFAR